MRPTPIGARFIRLVSIGLTAFLVGGAGVAVATIALAPLGAAIGAFVRTSRSVDLRQMSNAYAPPNAAGHPPADVAPGSR
ncbi:MAG: hypothetical protein ACJ757_12195 [Gaiellaceae bacterium]